MLSILIAVLTVIADQISKYLCRAFLHDGSIDVIPGVLRFTYVENKGAAFGMMSGQRWIFILSSIVIIAVLAYAIFRFRHYHVLARISFGLLLGGGIGNMIDRLFLGYVVDFIDFYPIPAWKWVFNIADCGVTVGCVLLTVYLLFLDGRNKADNEPDGDSAHE